MEMTLSESLCYYLGLNYDYFKTFYSSWFSVRSLVKKINFSVPPAPTIYVNILLKDKSIIYNFHIDSDSVNSSLYDFDSSDESVKTFNSELSEKNDVNNGKITKTTPFYHSNTPDIVKTIQHSHNSSRSVIITDNNNGEDGLRFYQNSDDGELDPGFCSDRSCVPGSHDALRKLEQLELQFSKMQRDIAGLVEIQRNMSARPHCSSFIPTVTSSPNCSTSSCKGLISSAVPLIVPPPPPALPPPPPPSAVAYDWRNSIKKNTERPSAVARGVPDMAEVLKGLSSVVLRPVHNRDVHNNNRDDNSSSQLVSMTPLRRHVTKQESIIASALRERFNKLRLFNESDSTMVIGDWLSDDNEDTFNNVNSSVNFGRSLLRKVDRSELPQTVYNDFIGSEI